MEQKTKDFNLQKVQLKYPPDISECYGHRKANIIFKDIDYSLLTKHCQCCGKIIGQQPKRTICYDSLQLSYLGPGIPLYFIFIKSILLLLFSYICIFGIYGLISDIQGQNCLQNCGNQTYTNKSSIFNIFDNFHILLIQKYIILGLMMITIIAFMIIRCYMYSVEFHIDQLQVTPSDYSLLIRNISHNATSKDVKQMVQEIRPFLDQKQKKQTNNLQIAQIIMLYDINQYLAQKQQSFQKYKKLLTENKLMDTIDLQFLTIKNKPSKFSNTAILIFNKAQSKKYFLQPSNGLQKLIRYFWGTYNRKSSVHRILNQYVSISRAPQPDQLIWQNCGKTTWQLFFRRLLLNFFSFLILIIGGGLQFLIAWIRQQYIDLNDTSQQILYSTLGAITISIFNFLIVLVLNVVTNNQKYDDKSQLKTALTIRIIFFQFLNTGIFVIIVNVLAYIIVKGSFNYRDSYITFDITQIIIVNAIVNNIINLLLNRFEINKLLFRYLIKKQKITYTQLQANSIFQPPQVSIQYKYAYIFKTFWLTAFFLPTIPYVIFISFLGLFINFWIQKYLFSGCYKAPQTISSYLHKQVMNLLNYTLVWLTLGSFTIHWMRVNFIFDRVQESILIIHIIFLSISMINIFLPYRFIMKRCLNIPQQQNIQCYEKIKKTFQLNYLDTNPIYVSKYRKQQQSLYHKKMKQVIQSSNFLQEFKIYL